MSYFGGVSSLQNLKKLYRKLAFANHPDRGGDAEVMRIINAEYDVLYAVWRNRHNSECPDQIVTETAAQDRSSFYTENGWTGKNYDSRLTTKEITARIRSYVKKMYPTWKFSVSFSTFAGGSSIEAYLTQAPRDVFDRSEIHRLAEEEIATYGIDESGNWTAQRWRSRIEQGCFGIGLNPFHIHAAKPYLTLEAFNVLSDVLGFIKSYQLDDSDARIDYFRTNFFYSLNIGHYLKGFKIVPKDEVKSFDKVTQAFSLGS